MKSMSLNINQVATKVHEASATNKQVIRTLGALLAGIVCGLLMQYYLDEQVLTTIKGSVLSPVRDVFLNALKMMMAPVTFFAILSGVTNISDTTLLGKLGGKMVGVSIFMQVLTTLFGLCLALLLFSGDLTYIQEGIHVTDGKVGMGDYPSLTELLFGIVPKNLVDPFKGENILQVIFIAIFFGIVINKMGDKAKRLVEFSELMFQFSIVTLKMIVHVIPVIVFLSMTALFASTGINTIAAFGSLFGGLSIGVLIVWGVGMITTLLFARLSPLNLTSRLAALSPLVFTVSSSHARLPFVLKFCSERLGIDSKLAAFSIPVGVQLNKAGNCIFFSLMTMLMIRVYDIEVTPDLLLTMLVSVCIMSIAKPPVPCGGIICLAYLFSVVGVPAEAISVVLCIDPIAAMFNGVCNESANITTCFILAKNNQMLVEEKYYRGS